MGPLASANSGSPLGNFRPADPRALRENPPHFFLDRYAAQTGLWPQPLDHLVIEVPDDDRCHVAFAYLAAMPAISTKYLGAARRASTVARAGGLAGSIHESHTLFMSSK